MPTTSPETIAKIVERRRQRRAEWFAANGPCRHCGTWDDLELDHIDPATKVTTRVWGWSRERAAVELAKCQPLCTTCHRTKTATENHRPDVTGELNGHSRLTADLVVAIRRDPRPVSVVALAHGLHRTTVWKLRTRRAWAHLA